MRNFSIRASLTSSLIIVLALLVVVSASAVTSLVSVNHHLQTINQKWLIGSQLLGDLKNTISEFRVVEGYRTLAADQPSETQMEFLADRYGSSIVELIAKYKGLVGDKEMADDLQTLEEAWKGFLKQRLTWLRSPAGDNLYKTVGYGSILQTYYERVQLAVSNLIDDAKGAANAEAALADQAAHRSIILLMLLSAVTALLTVGLIARIEFYVTRPLHAITTALTGLATGRSDTRVPELHRNDEIGAMATAFEVFRANAVALTEAQERAEALARHDALTGLPNRRLFSSELEKALQRTAANGSACAVMLIDLDRFKPVNDLHGHGAGDLVLCEIASRLRNLMKDGTIARIGGDEFAVITPISADLRAATETAMELASRIVKAIGEPVELGPAQILLGASIGISLCQPDGNAAEDILRTADLAMYRAKHDGRGSFRFFEDSMDEELRAKAELEAELRLALKGNEIKPHYQPLIDLASERIAGFEALARWSHPARGSIPPDTFIPLIGQLGLLDLLTESIVRQVIHDARDWDPEIRVAVNISPGQFQNTAFPATLAALLLAENFSPHRLEIEVTETALVGDLQGAKFTLAALQLLGVRVVLDDFGTGYSSLSHLRELKFDKIKIDRSFIRSMTDNAGSRTIVDAILDLARNLGMPVVAEGIETAEVMGSLKSRGCDYGQGYLFSKAVPADHVGAMLMAQADRTPARAAG